MQLGIDGFAYSDLYDCSRLRDLSAVFAGDALHDLRIPARPGPSLTLGMTGG